MDNRITREEFDEYNKVVLENNELTISESVALGLFISAIILFSSLVIYYRTVG